MEFYEIIEKAVKYIPSQYTTLIEAAKIFLSAFFIICAGATCFFGHSVHKLWNMFFFFLIGFLVPTIGISLIFPDLSGFWYYLLIILGLFCGICCAVYSKKLFKIQLFVTTFLMIFISLPSYISFLGNLSVPVGFAVGVIGAVLSLKYKYITVIITTSFSGAFMLWDVAAGVFELNRAVVYCLAGITGIAGLAVQCIVEKKELKETAEHLKKKKEQLKKIKNKPFGKKNKK